MTEAQCGIMANAFVDSGSCYSLVDRSCLPGDACIDPTNVTGLVTIDETPLPVLGVSRLTVCLWYSPSAVWDRDNHSESFDMVFLVVERLAHEIILGHDFLTHFGMEPGYSEGLPLRLFGFPSTREAPRIHPLLTRTTMLGATLHGTSRPSATPYGDIRPLAKEGRGDLLAKPEEAHGPQDVHVQHRHDEDWECSVPIIQTTNFDATHGKLVFAAVKDTSKVNPLEATPFCFRSETADEDKVASIPEQWPGPGIEPDSLLDDDLAQALQFAVPDFTDVGKTLPVVSKDSPAYDDLTKLCNEFGDLFKNRPGLCESMEHSIPLTDPAPIVQRVRPLPHKLRAEVQDQLKEMEQLGVISRSTSAYKFPCVFAAKKNGKVRICIDYRALNKVSKVEAYPVPRPDDVQEHLAGATIFSTLDLRSGYWQLKVRPSDRHKTAFCPGPGFPLYEWNRMPFGLSSAPASFQRLMDYIVGEFDFVRVYLDDILVFSRTPEEHVKHLRLVFKALLDAGLTLSGEKCSLGLRRVVYLGHVYSAEGMSPDPAKVDSIVRWPVPKTSTELRSFLGLAGYYRHFIPHYSDRARCLQELLKGSAKDEVFTRATWLDIHDQAFIDLKQALIGLPSLDYPDFSRPFQIASDASDYAFGGVLEQDGRPLAFYSQTFTGSQVNWAVYEKEAYALMKCLERFQHLHYGYALQVTCYTDHRPLQWLEKATSQKLQRWLLALQQYKFTVVYIPASKNAVADALSRVHLDPSLTDDGVVDQSLQAHASAEGLLRQDHVRAPGSNAVVLSPTFSFAELLDAQKEDVVVSQVASRVQDDTPLSRAELKGPDFIPYKRVWKTLDVCDGLLVRQVRPSIYTGPIWVPVVPSSLRPLMIQRFHDDVGHVGAPKLLEKIQTLGYWPCMAEDIERYVSSCDGCLNSKKSKPSPAPLMPVPIGRPWETVAIDLLTVPENPEGISTLLVLQDYFTKWAHVVPLKEHTWSDVARPLYHLFLLFGPPLRLHSDQGPPFESWMFKFVLGLLGIKKSRSSVYHPIGNGLVERFNQTFIKMLRVHVETTHDWYQHLGSLVWFYNTNIHSSTQASPFYLMFGRDPPDLWFPSLGQVQSMLFDPEGYALYLSHTRAVIQDKVNQCVTQASMSYKASYDSKSRERQFRPGMRVRMETLGLARANKLSPRWEGEWYVLKALPGLENKTVEVVHPATNRVKIISVDHLFIDPIQPEELPTVVMDLLEQESTTSSLETPVVPDLPYQHGPEVPIVAEYGSSVPVTSPAHGTGSQDPETQSAGSSSGVQRSSAPVSVDGARPDGASEVDDVVADFDGDSYSGPASQGSQALQSALGSDVPDFVSVDQSDSAPSGAEGLGLSSDDSALAHSSASSRGLHSPDEGEDGNLEGEESGVDSQEDPLEGGENSSSPDETAVPPQNWSLARDRPRREVRPPKRFGM